MNQKTAFLGESKEKMFKKTEKLEKSLYNSKIPNKIINNFLEIFDKYEHLINMNEDYVYDEYLINTTCNNIKKNIKTYMNKSEVNKY